MTEENKKGVRKDREDHSELEQEASRKVRNLADKAKEKAEKKLRERKAR
ncbi:MAG: hypothetical protein WA990_14355 [Rubrobacteraceae bacterium]